MAIKYDIPDTYLGEYVKWQELFLLGTAGRASYGSGTFISSTSAISYPYTDGNDLFGQLQAVLSDYLITASDYNKLELASDVVGRTQSVFDFAGATLVTVIDTDGSVELDTGEVAGSISNLYSPTDKRIWRNIKVDTSNLDANNNLYYKLDNRETVQAVSASYDSKNFSVAGEDTAPVDLKFGDSGSKCYVVGVVNQTIYQYTLSTPWDASTGSYAGKNFNPTEGTILHDINFNANGSKCYILDNTTDTIYQYSMSTNWDISTCTSDGKSKSVTTESSDPQSISLVNSGSKLFVLDGDTNCYQYTLSTAYDISTAGYDTKVIALAFSNSGLVVKSDGTKVYACSQNYDLVSQFSLSTAYDISTATLDSSINVLAVESEAYGIDFKDDGTKFYIAGNGGNNVTQWSFASAWSIYDDEFFTDTSILTNTEITTNGTQIIDLSNISLSTYPNDLLLTYIFERDGIGDTSPVINNNNVSWEGPSDRTLYDDAVTTSPSAIVSITVPSTAQKIEIELEDLVSSLGVGADFGISFNGDSSNAYGYCYQTTATSTGGGDVAYISLGGVDALLDGRASIVIKNINADNEKTVDFTASSGTQTIKGAGTCSNVANKISTVGFFYTSGNINAGLKYKVYYYE